MRLRVICSAVIPSALALLILSAAARGQTTTAQTEQTAEARAAVEDLVRQSGARAAVAFRSLDGSQELFMEANEEFPAKSQWLEIPVMVELQAEVEARTLKFEDTLVVENQFRSVADGSAYQLDPGLDPDAELYRRIGQRITLHELETRMMKRDSQLATNLLLQLLGISRVDGRLADLHANGIQLRHGFQDLKADKAGERNTASARGMMQVLWSLATNNAVSADASKEMVGLIANSRTATSGPFADRQTTGAYSGEEQESVIVYGARSFALAVVVRGLKSPGAGAALMARISYELAAAN
ncbi:MAG: serine hydrolase [Candidatus Acidiferrales bacterium]